ncbi:MAG TPA: 2-dehydro-3-deoxygalactonokinase, partial [Sulfitobacter pontiacus]|nr:2-dehydro-3-deoxygalactonokinase [Sulfitobacter pontiacus]
QGAETAIAGYLQAAPEFDGVICCLDAQSTWAHISAREVVSFQSFLTPVMATQLSATAPLSKAVVGGALDEDTFD